MTILTNESVLPLPRQGDVMRKANAGKGNERQLFHGTDSKHVDAICLQNIAWRMGGTQGTPYGQGEFCISCDI